MKPLLCVGVDGCRAGWIAVWRGGETRPSVKVFAAFADILQALRNAIVAVDMPIGLPERLGSQGRGPEKAVRAVLDRRRSSVFSIPARAAVHATEYADARRIALATSDPPRSVAAQAFGIFAKIREIDALMTRPLERRVFEVHPELAFWRLNGGMEMRHSKKTREGAAERRRTLARHGLPAFGAGDVPAGAAVDDLLDAAACMLIAGRIAGGEARPFPDPPLVTETGARMAIWA
jgi:predicted RNase H-like nuclease